MIRRIVLYSTLPLHKMVQAAESGQGLNLASSPSANCDRPARWDVLLESKMSPVLVGASTTSLAFRTRG
jgi:hypothetical protein